MCMADNAHFSWETPGMAANALQEATAADKAIGLGMLQPLRDLRHVSGLVTSACNRLVQGLARGALTLPCVLLNALAIFLIAKGRRTT